MSRVLRGHLVGFPMFLQETQHLEARRVGEGTAPDPINHLLHGSPPLIAADWLVRGTWGQTRRPEARTSRYQLFTVSGCGTK